MLALDTLINVSPLVVSTWACFRAAQMYRHAARRETLFAECTGEILHLRYLREISLATMVLSVVYFLAKFRCTILSHYRGMEEADIILWAMVDMAIFGVLALLCLHGSTVADSVVRAKEIERKNRILHAMIEAAGGFVWIKDADGRYVFCDNSFCHFFFDTPAHESVVGFTDVELLEAFRSRTKKQHTFGEMCMSTDTHCRDQKTKCRYIETGYIDGSLVILDIVKTPLFDEAGAFTGTVGMAWDRAEDCDHIQKDISMFKAEGRLEELCTGVFWVKSRIDECKWGTSPTPELI